MIPGPPLPRVAALRYFAGWFDFLERCHRRYGDVFRLQLPVWGPVVVIADPEAVRTLYNDADATVTHRARSEAVQALFEGEALVLLDGAEHLRRRRLLLPHFGGATLISYEQIIADVVRDHVERLTPGDTVKMTQWSRGVAAAVMARLLLGIEDRAAAAQFDRLLRAHISAWTLSAFLPAPARRERVPGPWQRSLRLRDAVRAFFLRHIEDQRRAKANTICSLLASARDTDGRPLSDGELYVELLQLTIAGLHTTSLALSWTIDCLIHDASSRKRFEACPEDEQLATAIVQETLRLRPVIDPGPRKLTREITLSGTRVAAGCSVYPSAHLVHMRAETYERPKEFRPHRFIEGRPKTYAWLPYGAGPHRCLGAGLAQLELRVALRELFVRRRLEPLSRAAARPRRTGFFWKPAGDVPVRIGTWAGG